MFWEGVLGTGLGIRLSFKTFDAQKQVGLSTAAPRISQHQKFFSLSLLLQLLFLAPLFSFPLQEEAAKDQPKEIPEYVLKAGFIYNFAKYVEWPAETFEKPESPILIGVIGDKDPFAGELEKTLKNKTLNNRSFVITFFKDPTQLKQVHILFIARAQKEKVAAILKRMREFPALTVGEDENFIRYGGMVNILIEDKKPKLQINPEVSAEQKLKIDSKLLKIATIAKKEK